MTRGETFVGSITEDIDFYHVELNKYPALSAKIKFKVSHITWENNTYAGMPIHTRKDDRHLKNNCSITHFGQVRNEDLSLSIRPGKYRGSNCFGKNVEGVFCTGNIPIQDYVPSYFSVSFGFLCKHKTLVQQSLKGLQFNLTIYDLTNHTRCTEMRNVHYHELCHPRSNFAMIPNLSLGNVKIDDVLSKEMYYIVVSVEQRLPKILSASIYPCHQLLKEVLCHLAFPFCEPNTGFTAHLCKELCEEVFDACWDLVIAMSELMSSANNWNIHLLGRHTLTKPGKRQDFLNCEYLPSHSGDIPCFYRQVQCDKPLTPPNAHVVKMTQASDKGKFDVHSAVTFSCISDLHKMEGNDTIVCLYTGEWSDLPTCMVTKSLPIVAGVFSVPVVLLVVVCLVSSFKSKLNVQLTRNREFDAFVCYQYDEDNDFVMNELVPTLEQKYKLYIHSLDFSPGLKITSNILTAIEVSNSAIIILSNKFLASPWCREEFEYCYRESRNDPAFKLLVILRQPIHMLALSDEKCNLISYFVSNNTFLEHDDRRLRNKVGTQLDLVKYGKNGRKRTKDCNPRELDTEEEEEMM